MKKTFPEFLATPIKNNPGAKKIFPVIGLKDKSIKLKVDKHALKFNFRLELIHYLTAFLTQNELYISHNKASEFFQLAQQVKNALSDSVSLSKDLIKKLSELRKLNKCFKHDKIIWWLEETFKTYHYLSKSKLKICFSTKQWDLATISMRGITSCQAWTNLNHRKYLQGTVLDPFVGVVYITDGKKTPYGNKMLFRSLIRYTFKCGPLIPQLFMEPIYHSSNYKSNRPNYNCFNYYSNYFSRVERQNNFMVRGVFDSFFEKYLPNKVMFGYSGDGDNYMVPRSNYEREIYPSLSDNGVLKQNWRKSVATSISGITPEVRNFLTDVLPNYV